MQKEDIQLSSEIWTCFRFTRDFARAAGGLNSRTRETYAGQAIWGDLRFCVLVSAVRTLLAISCRR